MAPNHLLHQLLNSIACLVNEVDNLVAVEFVRRREKSVLTNARRISNLVVEFQNFLKYSGDGFCAEETAACTDRANAQFLSRAIGVTEKNLSDFDFGIEKMARELAVSRRQLYRKIKTSLNCTPNDFIRLLRLNRAAKLLGHSRLTVAEITHAVGFSDLKYFRAIFRRHFGVLPKDYLRKATDCRETSKRPAVLVNRGAFGGSARRQAFSTLSLPPIPEATGDFRDVAFRKNCAALAESSIEDILQLK